MKELFNLHPRKGTVSTIRVFKIRDGYIVTEHRKFRITLYHTKIMPRRDSRTWTVAEIVDKTDPCLQTPELGGAFLPTIGRITKNKNGTAFLESLGLHPLFSNQRMKKGWKILRVISYIEKAISA